ncbi:MAG: cell division protein FtsQ/DivIB [Rhizobiaceae bacterium]
MRTLVGLRDKTGFAAAGAELQSERVLPRYLRKPYRFISRLVYGNIEVPRYAGLVSTFVLFLATGVYGTVIGGRTHEFTQTITAHMGFAISDIQIAGHNQTSEIDILSALGLNSSSSLVGFDINDAREKLAQLPWVASVEVTKLYPNGLSLEIQERKPFAIWQLDEELSLIEEDGHVIVPFAHQEYANLPLVTGNGAEREAKLLVPAVASIPELKSRVKAQMFIAGRRWDIRLDNGVTIQLPEGDPADALAGLAKLDSATGLLSKDILTVDLRVAGQMVVRLSDAAKAVRDEAIAAEDKAAKKAEKKKT